MGIKNSREKASISMCVEYAKNYLRLNQDFY